MSLRKLNILREFFDDQFMVIVQDGKTTRGRFIKMKQIKLDDERYYELDLITKKGKRVLTISGEDTFKVKKPLVSKVDPYGEEDWELS